MKQAIGLALLVLLIASLSMGADTKDNGKRPILAAELAHMTLESGEHMVVIGLLQSVLGQSLTLEACTIPLSLAPQHEHPLLYDSDARKRLLALTVQVEMGANGPHLRVTGVEPGPEPLVFLANLRAEFPKLPLERRAAIATAAVLMGETSDNPELRGVGRAELLAALTPLFVPRKDRAVPDAQTLETQLRWFVDGQKVLAEEAGWHTAILQWANSFETPAGLGSQLRANGYDFGTKGWELRRDLLAEINMVVRKGVTLTRDRAALDDAIDTSGVAERSSLLLRALTAEQYKRHAQGKAVVDGMNRSEVLQAWGYPIGVTWTRKDDRFYEAWTCKGHRAFFVNGLVFQVE